MSRHAAEELSLPSHSIALVKNASHPSSHLPASCDACQKMISAYPYIAKQCTDGRHRKYHVACALRIGVILRVPAPEREEILVA
jgi:hypothetical protein